MVDRVERARRRDARFARRLVIAETRPRQDGERRRARSRRSGRARARAAPSNCETSSSRSGRSECPLSLTQPPRRRRAIRCSLPPQGRRATRGSTASSRTARARSARPHTSATASTGRACGRTRTHSGHRARTGGSGLTPFTVGRGCSSIRGAPGTPEHVEHEVRGRPRLRSCSNRQPQLAHTSTRALIGGTDPSVPAEVAEPREAAAAAHPPLRAATLADEDVGDLDLDAGRLHGHDELVRADRDAASLRARVVEAAAGADRVPEIVPRVLVRLVEVEQVEVGHQAAASNPGSPSSLP
jgi:hypothetical protein